jgi:hypothetical protein
MLSVLKRGAGTLGLILRRLVGVLLLLAVAAFLGAIAVDWFKRDIDSSMISIVVMLLIGVVGGAVYLLSRPLRARPATEDPDGSEPVRRP